MTTQSSLYGSRFASRSRNTGFFFVVLLFANLCSSAMLIDLMFGQSRIGLLIFVFLIGLLGICLMRWPLMGPFLLLLAWPVYPSAVRLFELQSNTIVKFWVLGIVVVSSMGVLWHILFTRSVVRIHPRVRLQHVDVAVLCVMFTGVYAAILSFDLERIVYAIHITYVPLLMYFWVRILPFSLHAVAMWIRFFFLICALLALLGMAIHFTDPGFWYRIMVPQDQIVALSRNGTWRMTSILWNPLYFGPLMAIAGVLSFAYYIASHRLRYLVLFLLFAMCTWFSLTRGAYVLVAVGVILLSLFSIQNNRFYLILLMIGVAFGIVVFNLLYTGSGLAFMQDSSGQFIESRFPQFTNALNTFLQNPLGIGLGVGHASRRLEDVLPGMDIFDSSYFKILVESGLIGFSIFFIFIFVQLLHLFSKVRHRQSNFVWAIHAGILAAFVGFSVEAIVSSVWEHYMVAGLMWILLGLAVNLNVDGVSKPLVTIRFRIVD